MKTDDITIQPGTALVISGPQGCGKSRLAQRIAKRMGPMVMVSFDTLLSDEALPHVINGDTAVVEVIELPFGKIAADPSVLARVKQLITCDTWLYRPPFSARSKRIPSPRLIFTTNETAEASVLCKFSRRLALLELGVDGQPVTH